MDAEYFLKLDGIIGDSQDKDHAHEIDILGWSWDDYCPLSWGACASGGPPIGSGEVINVFKALDKATSALRQYFQNGRHIANGQFTCRRTSSRLEFFHVWFTDLQIKSVRGKERGETSGAEEEVVLKYTNYYAEYYDSGQVFHQASSKSRGLSKYPDGRDFRVW